jgi:hypothetical protein
VAAALCSKLFRQKDKDVNYFSVSTEKEGKEVKVQKDDGKE